MHDSIQKSPNSIQVCSKGWPDYELIDSGDGAKLERFGRYKLVRPEKRALWKRALSDEQWLDVDAVFRQSGERGEWIRNRSIPDRWLLKYKNVGFWAKLTYFRHTGIFPEQAPLWDWIDDRIRLASNPVTVLNLFGYTGIASLVAASAGAAVTHVDASKQSLDWARENVAAAQLPDSPVRWILDDALKFLRRESKRDHQYEGIILNPPAFGRGPKGELWRLETSLPKLFEACAALLSERAAFVLISINGVSDSSLTLFNLLNDWLGSRAGKVKAGELVLQDSTVNRPMSMGIFGRWSPHD